MEFALTPKQGVLRAEVREFLQHALSPEGERDLEDTWMVGFSKEFSAALGARGRVGRALLFAPAYTIQGGTSNILRNIIAMRGLGLPSAA